MPLWDYNADAGVGLRLQANQAGVDASSNRPRCVHVSNCLDDLSSMLIRWPSGVKIRRSSNPWIPRRRVRKYCAAMGCACFRTVCVPTRAAKGAPRGSLICRCSAATPALLQLSEPVGGEMQDCCMSSASFTAPWCGRKVHHACSSSAVFKGQQHTWAILGVVVHLAIQRRLRRECERSRRFVYTASCDAIHLATTPPTASPLHRPTALGALGESSDSSLASHRPGTSRADRERTRSPGGSSSPSQRQSKQNDAPSRKLTPILGLAKRDY
ncbi:hypothetical protein BJX63DRAFT_194015 [Aspergillus granulosus]|uniref:Uncharacterized protein n=1 Tax=Aspergillus granulosus TaxID=176169 RepID=A0ABR4HGJ8_9EURO